MPQHDVVVIGASSGGVAALSKLLGGLPDGFPAAVFIVLHVPQDAPSQLPAILNRCGTLPVAHAVDQERIRRGRVYVAPPGHQTYVHRGRLSVRRGPRENLHRPAIDPLFRTAAHHYGPRVIGVILSGALDDGVAGLLAVKHGGGIAVVQDPKDAAVPDMPSKASEAVAVDYSVAVGDMAQLLIGLVGTGAVGEALPVEVPLETRDEAETPSGGHATEELGVVSPFTCPDCSGTLWQIDDGGPVRFRCRVGHAYSQETMVNAQGENVERALWSALRALEERVALLQKLAGDARRRGHDGIALMFEDRSRQAEVEARTIHSVIVNGGALEPVDNQAPETVGDDS